MAKEEWMEITQRAKEERELLGYLIILENNFNKKIYNLECQIINITLIVERIERMMRNE